MISFIIIFLPLIILCLWLFFTKQPTNKKSHLITYNLITFLIVIITSTYFGYNEYIKMSKTVDSSWAPVTATVIASISFIVGILLSFLIRNFLLFRKK